MENDILTCDVVILGGGLVGGTMAAALAQAGIDVVVVDAEDPQNAASAPFDGRCSAVALSAQRVMAVAGLWDHIAPYAGAIEEIRVSDGASPLFLHYDHSAIGDDPFGWIVENRAIRKAIFARLPELPAATLIAPARLDMASIERDSHGVRARLTDGRAIAAQLIIGADGRASPTRRHARIGLTSWSYHQVGIVCTVAHEKPHRGIAQEHFLPAGPFAILPLPGNRSSIVWTEKEHLADAIMAQSDDDFLAELKSRFGDFLGDITVEGPRWAYPLSLQFADRYIDRRLALIGDAAHGMHPIAGQGMNMGIRDVAALAELLVDAKRLGLDLGAPSLLENYQRWRRFDNMLMLGLTDVLNRAFSNDIGPIKLARDIGMAVINRLPPVKKVFMRHAMGLVGTLPRMMLGKRL